MPSASAGSGTRQASDMTEPKPAPSDPASSRVVAPLTATSIRSDRLAALPPFLFNAIDDKKRAAIAAGKDVINLGVGDPDQPTPEFIIDEMNRQMRVPVNHQYPDCYGTRRFLDAAARFMDRRFGVKVDPVRHIVALMGSKDGIGHLPLGVVNPGTARDGVMVFTPAYPVYVAGATMAGATPHRVETRAQDHWLPRFDSIDERLARACRLMWLNFPGNPTGATADVALLDHALRFAARHDLLVASDLAYSEIYFHGAEAAACPSIWQCPSADIRTTPAIEFHSLSKTFNMTGWRIAFAVGHEALIGALKQTKDNFDSGPFNAVQNAGALALDRFDDPIIAAMRDEYGRRRDLVVDGLRAIGCEVAAPRAGIFVWARCPIDRSTGKPMDSWSFVGRLIDEAAVVTVPGAGFADSAAGWVRVSLTRETARIAEAMKRLASMRF
ncbi:MAG: aminotransferase class I/II-fold pyridoxal phosphate-dependent enzyme [Phycisphaerales bacterium]